ncbi:RsmE family RNA methyltransferase [Blastococcus sp. SYSU DS0539]
MTAVRRMRALRLTSAQGGAGTVVIVVGPEGGLSDGEVVAFRAAGAEPVRLGPEVLRTSTAGAAALAALSARTRWT